MCCFRDSIRKERSFMFSACAGVSSMASHTLLKRSLRTGLLLLQFLVTVCGQVEICTAGLLSVLLRAVKNVDGIREFCHVNHTIGPVLIANSYLTHALPNRSH